MSYRVNEIFYSLQGEGAFSGRAAVFCRFAGCNLWSGLADDRNQSACRFCDTDFNGTEGEGGGVFEEAPTLVETLWKAYEGDRNQISPMVVLTGGEPMLQVDEKLLSGLRERGFFIATETNGTVQSLKGIDWLTVSPKAGTRVLQKSGSELKVVYPQDGIELKDYDDWTFSHRFVQPRFSPDEETNRKNVLDAIDFCLKNPVWRLSLQTHRMIGMK